MPTKRSISGADSHSPEGASVIIRVAHNCRIDDEHTAIPHEPMQRALRGELSWGAVGLLNALLVEPDGSSVTIVEMLQWGPEPEPVVRAYLAELTRAGYINADGWLVVEVDL